MPLSAIAGALATAGIQSGVQTGGGIFSQLMNLRENRQQRLNDTLMYALNRKLNREDWMLENQYNSPIMQMQRLKEAGLNPNLVYGNGATATGGNIQSHQNQQREAYQMRNPLEGFNLDSIYNMQLQKAQTGLAMESAKTQMSIQKLNALKSLLTDTQNQIAKTESEYLKNTLKEREELVSQQLNKTLAEMDSIRSGIDVNQATIQQKRAETNYTVDKNIREAIQQKWSIKETITRIAKMAAEKELIDSNVLLTDTQQVKTYYEAIVQSYEAEAAKKGYKLGDNAFNIMLKDMVEDIQRGQFNDVQENVKDRLKKGIAPSYRK